jgi:amino acid transporter/nucleotide-binding universal stress UspA family protein
MPEESGKSPLRRAAQVIVVGSVMFTFISYWKTAAVVLCDLASTAYYIGGIAEQAIGPAAPWFILGVMVFSYAVRNVYIESCSMFVRGGVYRVVREAMGGFMGKLSVSALIFDYILTGPISSVSAGQYIFGLMLETAKYFGFPVEDKPVADAIKQWGAVAFAVLVTLYFFWQNLKGIHESSDKAFKIMVATTVMAVVILSWCGLTLAVQGPAPVKADDYQNLGKMSKEDAAKVERNSVPMAPTFERKPNPNTGKDTDPLGFISNTQLGEKLRSGNFGWLGIIGLIGVLIAFGHSILAMSGEETLAQVYREVEAPKLPNFRKAAFVVFVYSLGLTSAISFLAVLLIPNDVRMATYADNLIGGLSMHVLGPVWAKLLLNAFVVVIGALILSGAVNTAIIGSNGVLNRVAEDGVLPTWLLRPHPKYGTTYRVLFLILFLKLFTIIVSQGDVLLLGEAYAFGVIWSFVFMSASMVILRFKDKSPREFRMPFNLRFGSTEVPFGLIAVFLILIGAAVMNLLTKDVATIAGLIFTGAFLAIFSISERLSHRKRTRDKGHKHVEQFNVEAKDEIALSRETLRLEPRPYLKLIAIRSPQNLFMLEKALAETDPETTNVVVMTAKVLPRGDTAVRDELDPYEQQLMTAVVDRAEKAGKQVIPLIVPTNNPLNAVLQTARDLKAQEVVIGASNKYATDMQLEEVQFNWMVVNGDQTPPLSVRILGRDRDVYLDVNGGNRIPKISERKARNVAELRAAGVGVRRVLLYHDGTAHGSDLFRQVLTMLDPQLHLDFAVAGETTPALQHDLEQAAQLDRAVGTRKLEGDLGPALVGAAQQGEYDLIIVGTPDPNVSGSDVVQRQINSLLQQARCTVFVAQMPEIPRDASKE